MWSQGHSSAATSPTTPAKTAALAMLPCTVSQLLLASESGHDTFTVNHWEIHQVSVVGVVRGLSSFLTFLVYSVDDMTGPPLPVRQWVICEDSEQMSVIATGEYVKVIGSLRKVHGKRTLVAMNIRRVMDLNEITSHMMEVVQAHMDLSAKVLDVNMNTIPSSSYGYLEDSLKHSFSTAQNQVIDVIRRFSVYKHGISLDQLKTELDWLNMKDIRKALTFLLSEGHVFSTIDEHHFKC